MFADVSKPILGADFLHHFGLVMDLRKSKLVDTNTHLQISGIFAKAFSPNPTFLPPVNASADNQYTQLLSE